MPDVPAGFGDALRAAAKAHREAQAPASYEERRDILRGLRLSTVARNESEHEARASFEKLIADLQDVPADILRAACSAYANEPGTRYFPRGAGELRSFINPLVASRARRAWRLNEMAKASDEVFDESKRCRPEDAAKIMEEFGLKSETREMLKAHLGSPRKPTASDYEDIRRSMGR